MAATSIAVVLQQLEDELFYAVFDVALDIDQELTVHSADAIRIGAIRDVIRFRVLYPAVSVEHAHRYRQLRLKGLALLEKQSLISSPQFHKWGMAGWEGNWEFAVLDPTRFDQLLEGLKIEHERRYPTRKTNMHDTTEHLLELAESFHRVALCLRRRRTGREPIGIKDEYDVQYVFAALLESQFDDVRAEEWTPSYAGGANRMDFFLKKEFVMVETKMTREGLSDHKLGDELIIDIEHCKQVPDCKALLCFVYDPEHLLKNPRGLENDLTKQHDGVMVSVVVRPK